MFKAGYDGVELVGVGRWGVAVRGGGLRRNILRGRRLSHAVVAGCGVAVEGGLENMKIQPIGYKPFG